MSPGNARRTLERGQRLADQAEVAQAALAGDLSAEQATAVCDGVAANRVKAPELIEAAKHASMPELNQAVAKVKAEATDREARRQAIHAKRSFRRWTDRDSAFQAHLYGNPQDGARLWRMLDPIRRRLTILRRGSGDNESFDALDYDAIMTMAAVASGHEDELGINDLLDLGLFPQLDATMTASRTGPGSTELAPATPPAGTATEAPPEPPADRPRPPSKSRGAKKLAGSPARIMVRVDLDSLLRGVASQGELCEIAGYGPIPVSVVQDLMANDNPFVVGVLTKSEQTQGIYHHGRSPTSHQKSALDFLYPSCAAKGCAARAHLQSDHREDWHKTKFTVFDLLDRLCPHHHRLKTHQAWALVEGTGKRDFVPPHDPRHPRHPIPAPSRRPP
jgi:hypothetical protein